MTEHFKKYGWVSFLSYVAESNVFNVTGLDSIDSAKQANLYKVLVWASERKEREETIQQHYENLRQKK